MVTPRTTHTAALTLEYGDRLVLGTVRDVHRAVARRAFGFARRIGVRAPEVVHDAISGRVYEGLSLGFRGAGAAARAMGTRGLGRPVDQSVAGRQVVAVLNGLFGADLLDRSDSHAIDMALRKDSRDIPLDPDTLARTYPEAGPHIVLFVHGLSENDDSWRRRPGVDDGTYVSRIGAETWATPVLLRYNSGLHVSDNGAALAALVEELVQAWPVPVDNITLVGHSMGGLVIRAATNQGVAGGAQWPQLVRHVVCLGTPHLGAALEKVVHVGGRVLRAFPESAPFGRILDTRSPGIVDLRHGYISRQEWEGQDLSARWGLDRIAAAALPGADYHFVAATLGPTRTHPVSWAVGDWFVRFPSAAGLGRGGEPVVEHAAVGHLESTDHFALLNHPRVADWLVRCVNGEADQRLRARDLQRGDGRVCALSEQGGVRRGSGLDRR